MSNIHNERWLESAQENFAEALVQGDLTLAKAIIADVQEAGFLEAGRILNQQLREITSDEKYE